MHSVLKHGSLPAGIDSDIFDERLLHLLEIGRDCVDIELVRWALRLQPDVDLHALLQSRKHVCGGSNAKTGLVRPLGVPSVRPRSPLRDHVDLLALSRLIADLLDIYIANGNKHVSYWQLHDQLAWDGDDYRCLREHFTLPRLLACFSLFDHNFGGQQCALSKRNYAVWGAERVVKGTLQKWQNDIAEPLAPMEFQDPSVRGPLQEGRFLSFVDVIRQLRWTAEFAPHVGEMLEWAWQTPGLELGIRLSSASFACRDVRWEDKDRSEKGALHALADHLETKPGLSEHIAALRSSVHWRDYGLGPLEKFVRKYTAWFQVSGDRITLCHKSWKGDSNHTEAHAAGLPLPKKGTNEDSDIDDSSDMEGEEPEVSCASEKWPSYQRPPRHFTAVEGHCYHEICQKQALLAPGPELGLPNDIVLPHLRGDAMLFKEIGEQMERFMERWGPRTQDLEQRWCVFSDIQRALALNLRLTWPKLEVSLFGTSASGLARRDSDLDLLLDLDGAGNRELPRSNVPSILSQCEEALGRAGAEELQGIPNARIPIVRGKIHGIRFDLSLGTTCGLWNTAFLRECLKDDPGRVMALCSCVSSWSKMRGVNDSPNGLLSTYSVLLMVIFYLQIRGHLPRPPADFSKLKLDDAPYAPPVSSLSHEELGRTLVDFFTFICSFRWDCWIASVRCATALPRSSKGRAWRVAPLCVEDPFETHLNTCRRVNPRARRQILGAFQAALRSLLQGEGLQAILGPMALESSAAEISTFDELRTAVARNIGKNAPCCRSRSHMIT
ncbi:unnamed protein product [Durusdinium trenchii]|uniref:Uncharacterized protein n=2 Tax=Durusdinium trenchii TaxID=1381693 RepID=A0ABP0IDX4_9DINO